MKVLLDVNLRPIPACLVGNASAERLRPHLTRSWATLQRNLGDRRAQLEAAAAGVDVLGEMAGIIATINGKAAAVDRLVMVKAADAIEPSTKKLLVRFLS